MSDTVMKKYIPAEGKGVNMLKVELYYSLGGANYWSGKSDPRGYYLSITPVEVVDCGMYTSESVTIGVGTRKLVLEVARRSDKSAMLAKDIACNYIHELATYVCRKYNIKCEALVYEGV